MQTMNVSLPDTMKRYVDEQVHSGDYSSASEYVRDLVRADQKRRAQEQLENVLLEALRSGEPIELTPRTWEELRQKIRARAQARRSDAG
jgi:antitoxin ParD1/3/4